MTEDIVNRNTTVALLAGALLGAGAALLFAPQSGRKTRRDIRQFVEKTGNKAEAAQLDLRHSIENIIDDVKEKLQEGLAFGADWTDGKLANLQGTLEAAKKSIVREIEKIKPA